MTIRMLNSRLCTCFLLAWLGGGSLASAAPQAAPEPSGLKAAPIVYVAPTKDNYLKLADEVEAALHRDVLAVWFPRTIDTKNGGFHSEFTRDWKPTPSHGKFSVFQARMTWIAAQIVIRRPEMKD